MIRGINYAFHALVQLALLPPGDVASASEVAGTLQASPTYTAKLLQRLARAQLVGVHRGKRGGYLLARPAEAITLWDVVDALDGGVGAEVPPIAPCSTCPLASLCPLKRHLQIAEEEVMKVLQKVTVQRVAQSLKRASHSSLSAVQASSGG